MQHTGGTYTGISAGAGMLRIKRSRFGDVLHMKEVLSHNKAETAYFVQKNSQWINGPDFVGCRRPHKFVPQECENISLVFARLTLVDSAAAAVCLSGRVEGDSIV